MGLFDWLSGKNKQGGQPGPVRPFTSTKDAQSAVAQATKLSFSHEEEEYIRKCTTPALREGREVRTFREIPEAQRVLGPLNSQRNEEAAREAEIITKRYSDWDVGYNWGATASLRLGDHDRARKLLREGLERAIRKGRLCTMMGEVEWKSQNIREALFWWAQDIHCQDAVKDYEESPFLYLHYVAHGLDLPNIGASFISRVDQIRPGGIRLNPAPAANLRDLTRSQKTPGMPSILLALVDRYLRPSTVAQTPQAKTSESLRDRRAVEPLAATQPSPSKMSDSEMLRVLLSLCEAYSKNDQPRIESLEITASEIGAELNRRGGMQEMIRLFKMLKGRPGARTLEMHWGGIGDWRR
jgi:hypothetical protein